MPGLDVGPDLIQDEGDDVRLHGQEQDVAVPHRLLVAPRQVHPQLLREETAGSQLTAQVGLTRHRPSQGGAEPLQRLPCQPKPGVPCPVPSPQGLPLTPLAHAASGQVSTGAEHGRASPWQPGNGCPTSPPVSASPGIPVPGKTSPGLGSDTGKCQRPTAGSRAGSGPNPSDVRVVQGELGGIPPCRTPVLGT